MDKEFKMFKATSVTLVNYFLKHQFMWLMVSRYLFGDFCMHMFVVCMCIYILFLMNVTGTRSTSMI